MIKIVMKNGETAEWTNYSEYKYDGKFFIIIRGDAWVGFYNLDHVISITVTQANISTARPEWSVGATTTPGVTTLNSSLYRNETKESEALNDRLETQTHQP